MGVADTKIDLPPALKQAGAAKIQGETIASAGLLLVSEVSNTTAACDLPQIVDSKETPFVTTPIKRVKPPRVVMQKLLLKTLRRRSVNVEWVPSTDSDPAAVHIFSRLSKNGPPKTISPRIISSGIIGTRTEYLVPKIHLDHVLAVKETLKPEKPREDITEPRENNADLLEVPEEQPETHSLVDESTIGVDNLSLTQPSKLLGEELTIGMGDLYLTPILEKQFGDKSIFEGQSLSLEYPEKKPLDGELIRIEDLYLTQLVEKQFGDKSIFEVENLSLEQHPEKKLLEGELIRIEDLSFTQPAEKQFGDKSIFKVENLSLAQIPEEPLGKPTIEVNIENSPLLKPPQKMLGDGLVVWVDNLSPMDKPTERGEMVDIQQHSHSQNYASPNAASEVTPKVLRHPATTFHQGTRHCEYPTTSRRRSTEPVNLDKTINRKIKTKVQPKIANLANLQHCFVDKISVNFHQAPALRMKVPEGGVAMELTFSENSTVPTTGGYSLGPGVGCQSQPGEEQGMIVSTNDDMDGVEVSVGSGIAYAIGHGGGGKHKLEDGKPVVSRPHIVSVWLTCFSPHSSYGFRPKPPPVCFRFQEDFRACRSLLD